MLIRTINPSSSIVPGKIVAHPAWRLARSVLVEAITTGPSTIALLGETGTGKSCLLRYVESTLRKHGQAVSFLRQGDLPWALEPDTVLLIDEAARLTPRALAVLAAQRTTTVVLADLPSFGEALSRHSPPPKIVTLQPLGPNQIAGFVSEWLQLSHRDPAIVTPDGIARLAVHSGGTPRLVTRLLDAALTFAPGETAIDGAAIDEVADLRWSANITPAPRPQPEPARIPEPPRPLRRKSRTWPRHAAALAAISAAIVLAVGITELSLGNRTPAATQTKELAARLHPIEAASIPAPTFVPAATITLAATASALPSALLATPILTDPPTPALAPLIAPVTAYTLAPDEPIETAMAPEPPPHFERPQYMSDPGLIIIARRGDTLRDLYASLYRGVEPPPFEEIMAVNPKPVVPGAVVIFPAPNGGWGHP